MERDLTIHGVVHRHAEQLRNPMSFFQDIRSKKWLYAKGILFLLLATIAAGLLLLRAPRLDILVLLLICVWASCRAYYFAFYVIEHYVDSSFRFSGLIDFAKYAMLGRRQGDCENHVGQGGTHD